MVSTGVVDSGLNQFYDIISTLALVANLVCAFASTFDNLDAKYGLIFDYVDSITVLFFAIDYVLRVITAEQQYRGYPAGKAIARYVTSGYGIIDLLSFLPHYLPTFFPAGATVFRMLRVVRIFRLFRINAYSDSLSLIGNVLSKKKTQLLASVFVIVMLILASSLCMYSVEHEAQPDVFKNAFSAIWWATSTLLTVGYGDIYPITVMGQILGIVITFLGVGLVAIPTGIISAGFVEEYQLATRFADIEQEQDVRFIKASIDPGDAWIGKTISEVAVPSGSIIALVIRDGETIVPNGDVEILLGDKLIICAESATEGMLEDVKEIILRKNHSWNGQKIKDLDISRQTFIVLVDRDGKMLKPHGELVLEENDKLLVYTKENISKYTREPLF
ncbi:MAG: ion transporter [Mogibacterium sp.]|nr:ion transporter [Mogibacterium sp.]